MVEIVQYKNSWPAEFQAIATRLRKGLGWLALRIDHIGSTSVPGLAAKDVIDIQITVAALDDNILSGMLAMGYTRSEDVTHDHHPPLANDAETEWEKWYFKTPADQRRCHTHVRIAGRTNQRYALLFRDYLRTHPATVGAYVALKRLLAQHLADPIIYTDVKDPAVDLIYLAAQEWAKISHWSPGSSDA